MPDITLSETDITVHTETFLVTYSTLQPHTFRIDFSTFAQEFFIPSGCDTATSRDLAIQQTKVEHDEREKSVMLSFEYTSTLWTKHYHLEIFSDHVEFYYDLYGNGSIDTMRFFEGIFQDGYREHLQQTKHFNDKQTTPYRIYSQASNVSFDHVFNPEPNIYSKQIFASFEYSQVSANCDLDYCGGNFLFNPGLLCFLLAKSTAEEWVSLGLGVEPGQYLFSEYEYHGGTQFGLNLNYWGQCRVEAHFRTPRIIICTGKTPEATLTSYVSLLESKKLVVLQKQQIHQWWLGPIICGWGHQCYKADLFRVRSPADRPTDMAAYYMCTQGNYEEFVRALDKQELPWQILIIDVRWSLYSGVKRVDEGLWPDMRGFVRDLHARGKRVLLWWGLWETDGLDAQECITFSRHIAGKHENRPGRSTKFGGIVDGKKLAPDPTLSSVRQRIGQSLTTLLGNQDGGFDIDGLKIDHAAAAPGLYGLQFPRGSQRLYGIELLKYYQRFLYDTVKSIKSDALVIGQSANPYFADCADMLRLGDLYPSTESVNAQMIFRATMAKIANPFWLIDMDNWPIPSLKSLREYMEIQPQYGVPSLYYATHIDTTGERITVQEFYHIRQVWNKYREQID